MQNIHTLHVAIAVLNDTTGEDGLVPPRLVFGIIPRAPMLSTSVSNQEENLETIMLVKPR